MIRRLVLATAALAVVGGLAGPALASVGDSSSDGRHEVCVMGSSPTIAPEGICVWIPTN